MLKLYLWLFGKTVWYFLRRRNKAQTTVSFIFLLILISLAVISYFSGSFFAGYLVSFETFSTTLLRFTLLSMVSALSVLSLISFTIAFLKTLFVKNLSLVFIGGTNTVKLAGAVFIGTLSFGSWPFLLISLPFFLGITLRISSTNYGAILLVLLTHLIISVVAAAIAGSIAILIQRMFGRSLRRILPFTLVIGFTGLFFLFTNIIYPSDLRVISSAKTVYEVETSLKSLPVAWSYLPSTLFVDAFLGNTVSLIRLVIEAVFAIVILLLIVKNFYYTSWQSIYEEKIQSASVRWFFSSDAKTAFVQKEFLSLVRDTSAYLYMSFILFLVAVFMFFLSQSKNITHDYIRLAPLVKIASYFSVSYLMLLVCLRFVFPSLTLEKPFIWLVITVSNIRNKILKAKWIFYELLLLIFAAVLGTATGEYIKIIVFTALGIIMTAITLLIGGMFQGELPKRDIEAIATTGPGILLTVISLITGAVTAMFLRWSGSVIVYLLVFLFSLGFGVVSFYSTEQIYKKSDF